MSGDNWIFSYECEKIAPSFCLDILFLPVLALSLPLTCKWRVGQFVNWNEAGNSSYALMIIQCCAFSLSHTHSRLCCLVLVPHRGSCCKCLVKERATKPSSTNFTWCRWPESIPIYSAIHPLLNCKCTTVIHEKRKNFLSLFLPPLSISCPNSYI